MCVCVCVCVCAHELATMFTGDLSSRSTKPEIRVKAVQFSPTGSYYPCACDHMTLASPPTGRAWASVTTEGLLIYTLDRGVVFDPYDLSIDVTPEGISQALAEGQLVDALMMSFRLNEKECIVRSVEAVPMQDSEWVGY